MQGGGWQHRAFLGAPCRGCREESEGNGKVWKERMGEDRPLLSLKVRPGGLGLLSQGTREP